MYDGVEVCEEIKGVSKVAAQLTTRCERVGEEGPDEGDAYAGHDRRKAVRRQLICGIGGLTVACCHLYDTLADTRVAVRESAGYLNSQLLHL